MATQPNIDDIDLTQLDLADPETRKFAEGRIDLSDPETKKWWDSTAPKTAPAPISDGNGLGKSFGKGVRGVIQGAGGLVDLVGGPVNAGINWATGSQMSTSPGHDLGRYLADQLGLAVPEGDMEELANAINEGGIQGLLSAGAGMAASGAKGVVGTVGKALAESPLLDTLSGMAQGGAGKAAEQAGAGQLGQLGASVAGGLTPFGIAAAGRSLYRAVTDDGMVPESDFVRDLFIERGVDTTPGFDPRTPRTYDNIEVANRLQAAYDAGKTADELRAIAGDIPLDHLDEMIAYRQANGKGGRFVPETEAERQLSAEAAAFKSKSEPTVEDLFPTEESLAAKSKAMEEKLQAEATAFQNRNTPETVEAKPVEVEAPKSVPAEVQAKIDQADADIADLTRDWQNAPSYKTYENFDDLKGVDNDAVGATLDDGQVVINLSKIDTPATLKAVVFHEGLGHHGLTQKFGDDLDDTLTKFYDNSTDFKAEVDAWIKDNPGAYADSPNLVARAADEVLAKMSEKGPLPAAFIDKLKNMLKDFARKAGLKGVEYSDREIRTILGMAHDAVVNGKPGDVRGNGFRYSKIKDEQELGTDDQFTYDDGRPPEQIKTYTTEEVRQKLFEKTGKRYMKSLSPEKMRTTNDVDDLLDFLAEENLKVKAEPTTNAETIRQAEDMGLTAGKYLKGKGLDEQGIAAHLKAAHQLITNQLDDLEGLRVRADKEQMSPSLYAQIKEKLAVVQAVYAKFDADAGETGRALQILKDVSQSRKSAAAAAKFMKDSEGLDITSNPEALIRLLNNMSAIRQVEGAEAAAKHFRKTREAKAEDYIGSVVYNFMLSSPKTWIVNALGSPFNFLNDLVVDGISSVAGQALRLSKNAKRVHGREIAARMYGPLVAFQQYKTWKNIFDAFATGQGKSGSTLGKTGQRSLVMPGALTAIETPQRIMAGIDEFWANFLQMSNLYGEAAHESAKAGLKGKAFWADAAKKVETPTEELLTAASKKTNKQLFRDTPSKWGQKIIDAQTPRYEDTVEIKMVQDPDTGKMKPTSKTTRPKSTTPERVGKFVAKTVVPFVPTLDSIARTLIRNSGPVALFSKEIRKDLMTKGVSRQSAIARISLSSAVLGFWAAKAAQGELTGAGDPNYKKQQTLGAVKPPLSIKIGDEWVSYAGLDPIAGQMAAAATAVEMSKGGDPISKETGMGMIIGMATALKNSSYAESLSNAMNMAVEGAKGVTGVKTGMTATANFIGGQTANLLTPAFVRWMNQKFIDPAARDTTGDDSFGGRIAGRAVSGTPGLSDNLPQKYDVYGRPMKNLRQPRYVETDPTILELNRLEASTDKVLIGGVGPTVDIGEEKDVRLPSRIYQEYQKLAGENILSDLRVEIEDPAWNDYTDEEKIEIIKEVARDARKDARAELFGDMEEGELDDTKD